MVSLLPYPIVRIETTPKPKYYRNRTKAFNPLSSPSPQHTLLKSIKLGYYLTMGFLTRGLRIQRRIRLSKSTYLNLSKSTPSISHRSKWGSVGTKGFSIRSGIPGVYYRKTYGKKHTGASLIFSIAFLFFAALIKLFRKKNSSETTYLPNWPSSLKNYKDYFDHDKSTHTVESQLCWSCGRMLLNDKDKKNGHCVGCEKKLEKFREISEKMPNPDPFAKYFIKGDQIS